MTAAAANVGVVGLGNMGSRIAGRLLGAGHRVWGTNRTQSKGAWLIERGLVWCDTPREVAESVDVTLSMVADDVALEAVATGSDGILAGLRPEATYVDMSTVSPMLSQELSARARQRGAAMLAAPVSGSVPAAEDGTLVIVVGGDDEVFRRVEPLLRVLGRKVFLAGDIKSALVIKLAINMNVAQQLLAFCEGVLLAERAGVDRETAIAVLSESSIGSPMLRARGPLINRVPETAWFDVTLMRKDLRLAMQAATELEVSVAGTTTAAKLFAAADAKGLGRCDIAVVFQMLAATRASVKALETDSHAE